MFHPLRLLDPSDKGRRQKGWSQAPKIHCGGRSVRLQTQQGGQDVFQGGESPGQADCHGAQDTAAMRRGETCLQRPSLGLCHQGSLCPMASQHSPFLPAASPLMLHVPPTSLGNACLPNFVSTPKGNPSAFEHWRTQVPSLLELPAPAPLAPCVSWGNTCILSL